MGILSRLFGPKPEAPPEAVNTAVQTIEQFAQTIMAHYGEQHFQGDTQAKQVLSLYCFGGVGALAIQSKMSQPQAHAVALALLTSFFGYPPEDAAAKAQACITAAPDRTSHLYPTIHRGLDGFLHWQEHQDQVAAEDFASIMDVFKKHEKG
jgi:hypothetical protein